MKNVWLPGSNLWYKNYKVRKKLFTKEKSENACTQENNPTSPLNESNTLRNSCCTSPATTKPFKGRICFATDKEPWVWPIWSMTHPERSATTNWYNQCIKLVGVFYSMNLVHYALFVCRSQSIKVITGTYHLSKCDSDTAFVDTRIMSTHLLETHLASVKCHEWLPNCVAFLENNYILHNN